MPTPSTAETLLPIALSSLSRLSHTTCPPEEDKDPSLPETHSQCPDVPERIREPAGLPTPAISGDNQTSGRADLADDSASLPLSHDNDADSEASKDSPSPLSATDNFSKVTQASVPPTTSSIAFGSLPYTLSGTEKLSLGVVPIHTSSFLRHGSKFTGTQQSDRQVYNVQVEIKYVDMAESFICGYLRIEGLTADHPTLTTYFEGEIIGTKYTFQTRHAEWGSNEKVDMQHWNRFPAWRPLARQARRADFSYKNYAERENIFMRWKEYFLVPDHTVRSISGASFEGFYYICFNQRLGTVSGIYFHSKSEKFQQLELRHVDDRGCLGAMEFR